MAASSGARPGELSAKDTVPRATVTLRTAPRAPARRPQAALDRRPHPARELAGAQDLLVGQAARRPGVAAGRARRKRADQPRAGDRARALHDEQLGRGAPQPARASATTVAHRPGLTARPRRRRRGAGRRRRPAHRSRVAAGGVDAAEEQVARAEARRPCGRRSSAGDVDARLGEDHAVLEVQPRRATTACDLHPPIDDVHDRLEDRRADPVRPGAARARAPARRRAGPRRDTSCWARGAPAGWPRSRVG